MNQLLAAVFLAFNNNTVSANESSPLSYKCTDTVKTDSTSHENDSLIKQLYQFKSDSLHFTNKDHLLKNDPQTTRELDLKDQEKMGKEYRETEARRASHKQCR